MATDFTCCFKASYLKSLSKSESWCLGCSRRFYGVGFASWSESRLPASLDPVHSEENQRVSKGIWTLQSQVLALRVGSWVTEGVRKAVIHPSGSQSKGVIHPSGSQSKHVRVTFLCGTLCPDGEGRNFISPFSHLPII